MKVIQAFLLALSCAFTVQAQTTVNKKVESSFAKRAKAKGLLELTTHIVNQVSCAPEHIGLTLKLTFRNAGREPIILNRSFLMGGVLVSRDLKAAASKKYETYLKYDMISGDAPGYGLDPPTISNFIILKPGEVYEREDKVSVWTDNVTQHAQGSLRPGTHFLQVSVGTWPYITESAPFRQKWMDKGFLWSQGMVSLPMPFIIEKDRLISKCSTTSETK